MTIDTTIYLWTIIISFLSLVITAGIVVYIAVINHKNQFKFKTNISFPHRQTYLGIINLNYKTDKSSKRSKLDATDSYSIMGFNIRIDNRRINSLTITKIEYYSAYHKRLIQIQPSWRADNPRGNQDYVNNYDNPKNIIIEAGHVYEGLWQIIDEHDIKAFNYIENFMTRAYKGFYGLHHPDDNYINPCPYIQIETTYGTKKIKIPSLYGKFPRIITNFRRWRYDIYEVIRKEGNYKWRNRIANMIFDINGKYTDNLGGYWGYKLYKKRYSKEHNEK